VTYEPSFFDEGGLAVSTACTPVSGDLVVMGGRCQRDWRHSVPKQTRSAGPRISVNFRASSQARPDRSGEEDTV